MLDHITDVTSAAAWLLSHPVAPWQWDDEYEAIVWHDGTTIVFREELAQILERFSGRELPRFGALVYLLAACRGKTPEAKDLEQSSRCLEILGGLRRIAALPSALKSGIPARASLAMHALEGTSRSAARLETVIDVLRQGAALMDVVESEAIVPEYSAADDIYPLHHLLTVEEEQLDLLLQTGIPVTPTGPEDLDSPVSEQVGGLLEELLNDPELFGIARVARQVMAAVSLPEALSRVQDETLGGVSDIGNRGPLHRLLLSELANDDDTLSVRLALNEALYLRREPAANHPPSRLILVVDSGLRMWGLPRLFASAVALAFLGKAGKRQRPAAYRSEGKSLVPSPLWTKIGLIAHLAAIDSELSVAPALEALPQLVSSGDGPVDLILITHQRTLQDPVFVSGLPSVADGRVHAVGVDREGAITVNLRGPHGFRVLNEARLDLASLLERRREKVARLDLRDPAGDLPAILRVEPFPILLPVGRSVEIGWRFGEGGVCLNSGGDLWYWRSRDRGALRLPAPAIHGKTLGLFHAQPENCWVAVKYLAGERLEILRWFADRGTGRDAVMVTKVAVPRAPLIEAFVRAGFLYVLSRHQVLVIAINTGEEVDTRDLPNFARPLGSRFLDFSLSARESARGIFFWNGTELATAPLPPVPEIHTPLVLLFDRRGFELPWAVDQDGRIMDLAEPGVVKIAPQGRIIDAKASPSGNSVWLRCAEGQRKMVHLESGAIYQWAHFPPERGFSDFALPPQWAVRSKFSHIGLSSTGALTLRADKGYFAKLEFFADGNFQWSRHGDANQFIHSVAFGQTEEYPSESAWLRRAEWADGSRAFLDKRGLLHLRSSDPSIPEVSLVLAESSRLPAWTSDGKLIGPAYFIGDHAYAPGDTRAVADDVHRFASVVLTKHSTP